MSPLRPALLRLTLVAATATTLLGGCVYDYMQTTDRVGYSAGNAVRANIARETTNPSSGNMNDLSDLGSNGQVTPGDTPEP